MRCCTYSSVQPQRGLGRGDAGDRDRESLLRQVVDEVREALALDAEQVVDRHVDVGEEELGGVLRVQADLLEVATALEAVHAAFEHEQAHARVPLRRVGLDRGDHEVGVDAVGDERLGAVDDVVVAVADGGGAHRRRGRSRCPARSCAIAVMSSPDAIPGSQRRPLLVGRQRQEVGEADVVVQREPEAGGGRRRRTAAPRRSPGCSGSRRRRRRRTPRARPCPGTPPRRRSANSSRGTMPGLVPLDVVRHHLPLDEGAEAVAEQVVVLGELGAAHAARIRPHVGQANTSRATTRSAAAPAGASGRTGLPLTRCSADRSIHSRSPHGGSTSRAFGQHRRDLLRRLARVVRVALAAAEHQRGEVERARRRRRRARAPARRRTGSTRASTAPSSAMNSRRSWSRKRCRFDGLRSSTSSHSGSATTASMPSLPRLHAATARSSACPGS